MDPNVVEAKVVVSACGHDGPFGAASELRRPLAALWCSSCRALAAGDMSLATCILNQAGPIIPTTQA